MFINTTLTVSVVALSVVIKSTMLFISYQSTTMSSSISVSLVSWLFARCRGRYGCLSFGRCHDYRRYCGHCVVAVVVVIVKVITVLLKITYLNITFPCPMLINPKPAGRWCTGCAMG